MKFIGIALSPLFHIDNIVPYLFLHITNAIPLLEIEVLTRYATAMGIHNT